MYNHQRMSPLRVNNNHRQLLLPTPIPEPPRVINSRPLVPDLSITSDAASYEVVPSAPQHNGVRRPLAPISLTQQHHLSRFNSHFPVCVREKDGQLSSTPKPTPPPPFLFQQQPLQHSRQPGVVSAKNNFSNSGNLRPGGHHLVLNQQPSDFPVISKHKPAAEQDEIYRLLKQHDQHLQLISQQIQELLRINSNGNDESGGRMPLEGGNDTAQSKKKVKPTMCTVETMTSIVWPDERQEMERRGCSKNTGAAACSKRISSAVREIGSRRLVTIDEGTRSSSERESASSPVIRRTSAKAFMPSAVRFSPVVADSPVSSTTPARETARRGDSGDDSSPDSYYENMLANIDGILRTSSISDESEGDITRSSCSPTPPRPAGRRRTQQKQHHHGEAAALSSEIDRHHHHQEQRFSSAETIYINRLASKYLVTERKDVVKHQQRHESRQQELPQKQEQSTERIRRSSRKDYDVRVYGISREVSSIATKNYLEKYGLLNDQLNASRSHYSQRKRGGGDLVPDSHHQYAAESNRILDLERLKRQSKYK